MLQPLLSYCFVVLMQSLQQVLRAHPYIWIVSLLVTVVLMAAGVIGVLAAAQTETRHRKDSATGMAVLRHKQQRYACSTAAGYSNASWH
jgi:hypothetical protein